MIISVRAAKSAKIGIKVDICIFLWSLGRTNTNNKASMFNLNSSSNNVGGKKDTRFFVSELRHYWYLFSHCHIHLCAMLIFIDSYYVHWQFCQLGILLIFEATALRYFCFEIIVKFPDLFNRIKEDNYLRFLLVLIKLFEKCLNNILMHVSLISCNLVVMFDSLKGNLLSDGFESNIIYTSLFRIFYVAIKECSELPLHSSRTSYQIGLMGFTNF